jgi:hypothetical protein
MNDQKGVVICFLVLLDLCVLLISSFLCVLFPLFVGFIRVNLKFVIWICLVLLSC